MVVEGPGKTSYLEIAYRAPRATDHAFFPMMILDTILGGAKGMSLWSGGAPNRSSRLYRALVDRELAADVGCGVSPTVDPFLFSISVTVRSGRHLEEVERAVLVEMQRVMDEAISEAELQKAIKQTRAQFAYSSESVTDQGYWLGASEIFSDANWFESFMEQLAAVDVATVQRVAHAFFKPGLRSVGWYVPTDGGGE